MHCQTQQLSNRRDGQPASPLLFAFYQRCPLTTEKTRDWNKQFPTSVSLPHLGSVLMCVGKRTRDQRLFQGRGKTDDQTSSYQQPRCVTLHAPCPSHPGCPIPSQNRPLGPTPPSPPASYLLPNTAQSPQELLQLSLAMDSALSCPPKRAFGRKHSFPTHTSPICRQEQPLMPTLTL